MQAVAAVVAIIVKDERVFAARCTQGQDATSWEFPAARAEVGESAVEALRRLARERFGARLSTMWLLDTVEPGDDASQASLECYVCFPVPGGEGALNESAQGVWVGRDELADLTWQPQDRRVVEVLGRYWDQLFASTHL